MRYRMLGGLFGWLVALLPLAAVNAANLATLFSFQETILAGGLGILLGLLLGGGVAGIVGGRQHRAYRGGAVGGAAAGGIAALLYLATVLVLLAFASSADSAPLLLQDGLLGALWMLTALAFVALLFVAIAAASGTLVGRRAPAKLRSGVPTAGRVGLPTRQPVSSRAPGQPPRPPSGSVSRPPTVPRPRAPDVYPRGPRPAAPATRPRDASGRLSRQP